MEDAAIPVSNYAYDKAKYHYETVEEEGLPLEHAANHTVYFLRWLIERDLLSEFFRDETKELLEGFRRGEQSIHDVYDSWDDVLASDMLSEEGNAFAMALFRLRQGGVPSGVRRNAPRRS
jgi:hypothetical protein